jgi:hypothetical protein
VRAARAPVRAKTVDISTFRRFAGMRLDRDFRRPCSVGLRFDVSRRVRARRRRSPVRRRFQCLATIDFDGARTLQALRPFGPRGGQSDRAAKSARQIKTQRRLPQRNKPSLPDAQEAPAQAVYWSSCRCLHKQHEGSGARVGGVASDSCSYRRRRPTAPQPSRRRLRRPRSAVERRRRSASRARRRGS